MFSIKYICSTLLVTLSTSLSAHAAPFSQIVVFGDSLSDTGNAYDQLGTLAMDPADYYMGRFSNGPVWVEYLAQQLQLAPPVANEVSSAGRNYAFGGAYTEGSGLVQLFINDIDEQVPDFINNDGGPTGDELIVVLGGANDFFNGQTNPATPVNSLTDDITALYNAGGRHFLVANLPLLGQTPDNRGTSNEAPYDARSTQFNSLLWTSLDNLETTLPGAEFFRVDTEALITDAIQNPAAFGFTNVTDPALGLTGIDPDTYLFWDGVHPTTQGHQLLADNAATVLFDALSTLPGDLDLDGFVGIQDLNTVLTNWNATVTPGNPLFGDPSNDGFVGIEDLNVVLANWNTGTPPSINVPDPAGYAILICSISGLLHRRASSYMRYNCMR